MKFTAEKNVEIGEGKWIVAINGDEWQVYYQKGKKRAIDNLEVKGFRKGKVPEKLHDKYLSSTSILTNAYTSVINDAWDFAKEQKTDIKPWSQPSSRPRKISQTEVEIEFLFDLRPEIKISDYKNIKGIEKPELSATEEEIANGIAQYQKRFAMERTLEGDNAKVAKGNVVIMDFEGFKDGVPFNGGKGSDYSLEIGSNTFIPGFEDGMIGMGLGENELKVTFPEDYQVSDLAGQQAVFKLNIKEIKERTLPKVDDELVKDLNIKDINNVNDLKNYVKKMIEDQKSRELKNVFVNQVIDKIIEKSTFEIPKGAIERETLSMRREFEAQLEAQKVSLKDYKKRSGLSDDDINKELFGDAKRRLESYLITDEVRKLEKLEATEAEIEAKYAELAAQFNIEVEKLMRDILPLDKVKQEVTSNKIIEFLYQNNG